MRNKVAVITGASRGLGELLSYELTREGVHVVGVARTEEALKRIQHKIRGEKGSFSYIPTDLRNEGSMNEMFEAVYRDYGGAEILVNNAGYLPDADILESKLRDFTLPAELNMAVPLYLTSRWLREYRNYHDSGLSNLRRPEIVLFTDSISGLISWSDVHPGYTSSKSGLMAGAQNIRLYLNEIKQSGDRERYGPLADLDVRCPIVYPHTIETEMVAGKSWIRMTPDVAISTIMKILKDEGRYGEYDDVVIQIRREDGIYAGFMKVSEVTSRPSLENVEWEKIADKEKIIIPEGK